MLVQLLIDTVMQIILFSIIPLLWWVFTARKKEPLLSWLGLKLPKYDNKLKILMISVLSLILLLAPGLYLLFTFKDKSLLANAKFTGLGIGGIVPVLIFAVIQTGFCEELFFRGFLTKRISKKFGFNAGNLIQSVLFGLLHGAFLFVGVNTVMAILIIFFAVVVGWFLGYLNEKLSNGSIISSWLVHSLVNIISSSMFLFGIIKV